MSKITTIYDAIISNLDTLYSSGSSYKRLDNPYELTDNTDYKLRKGYGLRVGSATPVDTEFKAFSNERTFTVILTRQVIKLEGDAPAVDTKVKEMLEDVYTGQQDFFNQDLLSLPADIERLDLGSQSELQFIRGEKESFIAVEYDLVVQFTEDL